MVPRSKIIKLIPLFIILAWCLSFIHFYNKIERGSFTVSNVPADGIVVLTGGPDRIEEALKLMESGMAKKLLISGVHPDVAEKTLQAMTGRSKELFDCCIDIDHKALDTVGNAIEAAVWSNDNGIKSLIIVTANYHMPRAMIEFRRHDKEILLISYPVITDISFRYLIIEHSKYLYSLLTGS